MLEDAARTRHEPRVGDRSLDVREQIRACGVVPVVALGRAQDGPRLGAALGEAGLPCAEITLRTAAGIEAIALMRTALPDLLVGAGTVLSVDQAVRAIETGSTVHRESRALGRGRRRVHRPRHPGLPGGGHADRGHARARCRGHRAEVLPRRLRRRACPPQGAGWALPVRAVHPHRWHRSRRHRGIPGVAIGARRWRQLDGAPGAACRGGLGRRSRGWPRKRSPPSRRRRVPVARDRAS